MISELFCSGQSCLHGMDARVKLLAAGIGLLAVSAIQGVGAAGTALMFALGLALAANLAPGQVFRRLIPANMFFLGLGLVLALTYGGQSLTSLSWISLDGLRLALHITLKGNTLLLLLLILVGTTSVPALSQALQALGVPARLTLLLAFTHRQIFLVAAEFQRLQRAARARGFQPACNLHTYKTCAVLFGQTLLRSLNRAERIHGAMQLRGFTGQFHCLKPPALLWRNHLPAALFCLPLLIICLYDRWPL